MGSISTSHSYFLPALSPGEVITGDRLVHLDLYKISLIKGQNLVVDVESAVNAAQVYLFNASGQLLHEQMIADFQAENNQEFSVFKNPFAELTAESSQAYYVGVHLLESVIGSNPIFPMPKISPEQYILTLTLSSKHIATRSLTPPPMHPGMLCGDRLIFGFDPPAVPPSSRPNAFISNLN